MVAKDDDATIGAVWVVVAITFDYQTGHGRDGAGCVAFASEAIILFLVYNGVEKVIKKALILLLISL